MPRAFRSPGSKSFRRGRPKTACRPTRIDCLHRVPRQPSFGNAGTSDIRTSESHETRQLLDRTDARESGAAMSARLVSFDQKRTELSPGTVLVREWDRQSQRVM